MIHKSIIAFLIVATMACAAAWPMSYKPPYPCFLQRYTESAKILFFCYEGTLRISHWRESMVSAPTKRVEKPFLGFGFTVSISDTPQGRSSQMHRFLLPMWFTTPVFAAYPIVALVRASKAPAQHGGRGMAIGGICTGGLSVVLWPLAILVMLPNMLPALSRARELSKRTVCSANLRGIGQSLYIYAQDGGMFPEEDADWQARLINGGYLTIRQLTCPL